MASLVEYSDGTVRPEKRARKSCLSKAVSLTKELGHLPSETEWARKESKVGYSLSTVEVLFGSFENMLEELVKKPGMLVYKKKGEEVAGIVGMQKWTTEEILQFLRQACLDGYGDRDSLTITSQDYAAWRKQSSVSVPSNSTIAGRFGGWQEAIDAMKIMYLSGVESGFRPGPGSESELDSESEPEHEIADAGPELELESEPEVEEPETDFGSDPEVRELESESESEVEPELEFEPEPEVTVASPEPIDSDDESIWPGACSHTIRNLTGRRLEMDNVVFKPSGFVLVVERITEFTASCSGEPVETSIWSLFLKDSSGKRIPWPEYQDGVSYLVQSDLYNAIPPELRKGMIQVYSLNGPHPTRGLVVTYGDHVD